MLARARAVDVRDLAGAAVATLARTCWRLPVARVFDVLAQASWITWVRRARLETAMPQRSVGVASLSGFAASGFSARARGVGSVLAACRSRLPAELPGIALRARCGEPSERSAATSRARSAVMSLSVRPLATASSPSSGTCGEPPEQPVEIGSILMTFDVSADGRYRDAEGFQRGGDVERLYAVSAGCTPGGSRRVSGTNPSRRRRSVPASHSTALPQNQRFAKRSGVKAPAGGLN